jgi:hypothetical protein
MCYLTSYRMSNVTFDRENFYRIIEIFDKLPLNFKGLSSCPVKAKMIDWFSVTDRFLTIKIRLTGHSVF